MNVMSHRSLDGSRVHAGFVDDCPQCSGRRVPHHPDSHHPYAPVSMAGLGGEWCVCGEDEYAVIHDRPYCTDCEVPDDRELGEPAPWWHRAWCRFVTRFGRP